MKTDAQRASLVAYLVAIQRSSELDRHLVLRRTSLDFYKRQVVDSLLDALDTARVPYPGVAGRGNLLGTAVY